MNPRAMSQGGCPRGSAEESDKQKLRVDVQEADLRHPETHGEQTYDCNPYRPRGFRCTSDSCAVKPMITLPGEISPHA